MGEPEAQLDELELENERLRNVCDELQASVQRFREIYDGAPVGYLTVDTNGTIFEGNAAAAAMLGSRMQRLYRRSIFSFVHREQRSLLRSHLHETFATEQKHRCEVLIATNGARWVAVDSRRDQRRPWYCYTALSDISDRKNAEIELREAHALLEQRVQQRTLDLENVNVTLETELIARKRAEHALIATEARTRALASEAALAEQRERRRLACDLHDGLSQILTLARIKLESIHDHAAGMIASCVREVRELLADAQRQAESLTFELSPPLLHDVGLVAATERVAEEISSGYGVTFRVEASGEHRPDDEAVRIIVFRAVRELMLNAAQHSRAHEVTVTFDGGTDAIAIGVDDDGIGFAENGNYGFGLSNVRERITYLGGKFETRPRPNGGTHATIDLPLLPHAG